MDSFQRNLWRARASVSGIRSVLDPADEKGSKNAYIDLTHKRWLAKGLRLAKAGRVLDFGCGVGRITNWVASKGYDVVGIDASPYMVGRAIDNMPKRIEYSLFNGDTIAYPDGHFSIVTSVWVMQHIQDEGLLATLKEIYRVLAEGGVFISIEQVAQSQRMVEYPDTHIVYKVLRDIASYSRICESVGFNLAIRQLIAARYGIGGRLVDMDICPKLPSTLIRGMVAMDSVLTRGWSVPKEGYIDCMFVMSK